MGKYKRRDDGKCAAKAKSSGKQCRRNAIDGLAVCDLHGGASSKARQAGARRTREAQLTKRLEAKATAYLAHEGIAPPEDPLLELGKLASAAQELTLALGKRVNALQDLTDYDDKSAPHLKVEAEMYERALDRTGRFLDMLVKHGYTERLVKIEETQVMMIVGVLTRVLTGLGLEAETVTKAKSLMAEEFRALEPRSIQGTVVEPRS